MSVRNRILLDLGLFVAAVIAYAPALTGVGVHEWLSIAIVVPALVHLVVNWDWVRRVVRTAGERLSSGSALNFAVDATLFVAAIAVVLSGLLVSQVVAGTFGITVSASALWHSVHSLSADATVVLLLAHFLLHAKWMAKVAARWMTSIDDDQALNTTPTR